MKVCCFIEMEFILRFLGIGMDFEKALQFFGRLRQGGGNPLFWNHPTLKQRFIAPAIKSFSFYIKPIAERISGKIALPRSLRSSMADDKDPFRFIIFDGLDR